MAYSTANPPWRYAGPVGRVSTTSVTPLTFSMWGLVSTDASSVVAVSSYFSNGYELGMRRYDQLHLMDITSTIYTLLTVTAVTTGGAATVTSLQSTV